MNSKNVEPWSQLHMHSITTPTDASLYSLMTPNNEIPDCNLALSHQNQHSWQTHAHHGTFSHSTSQSGSAIGSSRRPDYSQNRTSSGFDELAVGDDEDDCFTDNQPSWEDGSFIQAPTTGQEAKTKGHVRSLSYEALQSHLDADAFSNINPPLSPRAPTADFPFDKDPWQTNCVTNPNPSFSWQDGYGPEDRSAFNVSQSASNDHQYDGLVGPWPAAKPFLPDFNDNVPTESALDTSHAQGPAIRPRGKTICTTRVNVPDGSHLVPTIRLQKQTIPRKSRSRSMTDSKDFPGAFKVNARKGGRVGKLSAAQAQDVSQKRHEKSVCIGCRLRRVKVRTQSTSNRCFAKVFVQCERPTSDSPCLSCASRNQLCARATITEISECETCNCICKYCPLT